MGTVSISPCVYFQCEMLINNRKPPPEEVDEGIDHESPLFKAIMSNPVVQLGLNNPRCLLGLYHTMSSLSYINVALSFQMI